VERTWKVINIRYHTIVCLEELRKTTKTLELPTFGRRFGFVIYRIRYSVTSHCVGIFWSRFSFVWPSSHCKPVLCVGTLHRITKCEFSYPGNWL